MTRNEDVLVIGGGPGGYPSAIRAAQFGKRVLLVEKEHLGGMCLNWGCIPSKVLISAADYYYQISNKVSIMGITAKDVSIDVKQLQNWKNQIITHLMNGIRQSLKNNNVKILKGTARFLNPKQVEVVLENNKKELIEPTDTVIATGTEITSLKGLNIDEKNILSAKGALALDHVPAEFLIIGGGIIGLELGTVFAKLGSRVKIVEIMPQLMLGVDQSLVRVVKRSLKNLGVEIYTETQVTKVTSKDGKLEVKLDNKKIGIMTLIVDKIFAAIGFRASTKDLGLDKAGIKTDERGFIITNTKQQSNVPHIYAVGDCTGIPFLAHKATKQGIIAAKVIADKQSEAVFRAIPGAIFTDPEIAFAGMTEQEAKEAGYNIIIARIPFAASGRARIELKTEGFVKVVIDEDRGLLLGVQIVGPHASDLISEVALALEMGATAKDVALTIHPHPTLSEMIMEAVEAAQGKAIHVSSPLRYK